MTRLSLKAKLLGHVSEVMHCFKYKLNVHPNFFVQAIEGEGESRKKIAPALTTDFVTYFHGVCVCVCVLVN